jgi:hypothetical protein
MRGALAPLQTPRACIALLNLCGSSSEHVRALSAALLRRLTAAAGGGLPGFEGAGAVAPLFRFALLLTQSPRDRESAAGAALLRVLHARFVARLGWHVAVSPVAFEAGRGGGGGEGLRGAECDVAIAVPAGRASLAERGAASREFLLGLVRLLDARAAAFALALRTLLGLSDRAAAVDAAPRFFVSPLAHGLVLALRLLLTDLPAAAAAREEAAAADAGASLGGESGWRGVVAAMLRSVRAAQALAPEVGEHRAAALELVLRSVLHERLLDEVRAPRCRASASVAMAAGGSALA